MSNLENISTLYGSSKYSRDIEPTPHSALTRASVLSNVRHTTQKDSFKDIKKILKLLLDDDEVPGPRLLRMREEISETIGIGAQGSVQVPCSTYAKQLDTCMKDISCEKGVQDAAEFWRRCAVKQLRYDHNGKMESRISSATNEVLRLCHPQLRKSSCIVSLKGWGLCLDSLESPRPGNPRLPLLIFDRANCDLTEFIKNLPPFKALTYENLSDLALDIGSGLQAIHQAKICHGDLKLDNILVFDPDYVSRPGVPAQSRRWRAKICDFGSTHDADAHTLSEQYLGTRGWLPPESMKKSIQIDPQLCDIFNYGLVVFSLFLGISSSLIEDITRDRVADEQGLQIFYQDARDKIVDKYASRIDSHNGTVLRSRSLSLESQSSMQQNLPRSTSTRHRTCQSRLTSALRTLYLGTNVRMLQSAQNTTSRLLQAVEYEPDFGEKVNRLLAVMASTLNEKPQFRHREPWVHLRRRAAPAAVQRPLRTTKANLDSQVSNVPSDSAFKEAISIFSSEITTLLQLWLSRLRWQLQRSWFWIKLKFPFLRPGSLKQQVFIEFHAILSDILGVTANNIDVREHEGTDCHDLSSSAKEELKKKVFRQLVTLPPGPEICGTALSRHALYALARLRSRFASCCWKKITTADSEEHDELSAIIETGLKVAEYSLADATFAWAVRHKTAIDFEQHETTELFEFLKPNSRTFYSDNELTLRVLILLDCHFYLGQDITSTIDAP